MLTLEQLNELRPDKEKWLTAVKDLLESGLTIAEYSKKTNFPDSTLRRWINEYPELKKEYDEKMNSKPRAPRHPKEAKPLIEELDEIIEGKYQNEYTSQEPKYSRLINDFLESNKKQAYTLIATKEFYDLLRGLARVKRVSIKELLIQALYNYCINAPEQEIKQAIEYKSKWLD